MREASEKTPNPLTPVGSVPSPPEHANGADPGPPRRRFVCGVAGSS